MLLSEALPKLAYLFTPDAELTIDADTLGYIDLEDLVEATSVPKPDLCRACFDGVYPIELPDPERLGKHLLEAPVDVTPLPVLNNP